MKNIKQVAKKYRDKNGNEKITNKDLLFYILSRLDDIGKINTAQSIQISTLRAKQKLLLWIIPILLTIVFIKTVV